MYSSYYLLYEPRVLSPLEHWAAWTKRFVRTIAGDGMWEDSGPVGSSRPPFLLKYLNKSIAHASAANHVIIVNVCKSNSYVKFIRWLFIFMCYIFVDTANLENLLL